jgi:hypothetical protein
MEIQWRRSCTAVNRNDIMVYTLQTLTLSYYSPKSIFKLTLSDLEKIQSYT